MKPRALRDPKAIGSMVKTVMQQRVDSLTKLIDQDDPQSVSACQSIPARRAQKLAGRKVDSRSGPTSMGEPIGFSPADQDGSGIPQARDGTGCSGQCGTETVTPIRSERCTNVNIKAVMQGRQINWYVNG